MPAELPSEEHYAFTRKQQQAIELLARGGSNNETASSIGVNESTIRKWLKSTPGFAESVEISRAMLPTIRHDELMKKVPELEHKAVEVLQELLESCDNPLVRLKAAQLALDLKTKVQGNGSIQVSFAAMPEPGIPNGVKHRD